MSETEISQPSGRAMSQVKNKNNVTELMLRKQIAHYERERSLSILTIDHDRLDMKDFLRQIKQCDSDELPESRHWLGDRRRKKKKTELQTVRNVATAPAGGARGASFDRNIRTAPEKVDDKWKSRDEDASKSGRFRTTRDDGSAAKLTMYAIFSRRAELVDAGPVWGQPVSSEKDEFEDKPKDEDSKLDDSNKERKTSTCAEVAIDTVAAENRPTSVHLNETRGDVLAQNNDILTLRTHNKETKADSRVPQRREGGDFMKELLVKNAKRRYKKKPAQPLEKRLTEFYTKLDDLKMKEEEEEAAVAKSNRRRYILLTKGMKAALADSSDEEGDDGMHTV